MIQPAPRLPPGAYRLRDFNAREAIAGRAHLLARLVIGLPARPSNCAGRWPRSPPAPGRLPPAFFLPIEFPRGERRRRGYCWAPTIWSNKTIFHCPFGPTA